MDKIEQHTADMSSSSHLDYLDDMVITNEEEWD